MQPRVLRDLANIEITSRCNLACGYCIHPGMPRTKVDMTSETWAQSLDWLRFFVRHGTQHELNLSGVGESTMHPQLADWCREARGVLGPLPLQFTTNGRGMTQELVDALKPSRPQVCVSAHHMNLAGPASALLARAGLLRSVSFDPVTQPMNWAGQVKWPHPTEPIIDCDPLTRGRGFVSADGAIYTCCNDRTGESTIGHVSDAPSYTVPMTSWRICPECWQRVPADADVLAADRAIMAHMVSA